MASVDRIQSCVVVFDRDLSPEEASRMVEAIHLLRNVQSVGLHVNDIHAYAARERIRGELRASIGAVLDSTS